MTSTANTQVDPVNELALGPTSENSQQLKTQTKPVTTLTSWEVVLVRVSYFCEETT